MEAFKYLGEIIGKFTQAQRIIALLLLLLTITVVAITPTVVDALSTNNEECNADIVRLETRVQKLETENDTLALKIQEGRIECTNKVASREREFMQMLVELQRQIQRDADRRGIRQLEVVSQMQINGEGVGSSEVIDPDYHTYTDVDDVMKRIEKMKKDIKK